MKKLFLATSFSGKVNYDTGEVLPEFRREITDILEALRSADNFIVYCAIESEKWTFSDAPPEIGVRRDLYEIDEADAVLALLLDQPSEGLQYEMGYAHGKGKTVLAATPPELDLRYFNQGLARMGYVKHVAYDSSQHLAEQITGILS